MSDLIATMRLAAEEIRTLRHRNELLAAQVQTMHMMHQMVMATPRSEIMQGYGEDVAWQLEQMADNLTTTPEKVDPAATSQKDACPDDL